METISPRFGHDLKIFGKNAQYVCAICLSRIIAFFSTLYFNGVKISYCGLYFNGLKIGKIENFIPPKPKIPVCLRHKISYIVRICYYCKGMDQLFDFRNFNRRSVDFALKLQRMWSWSAWLNFCSFLTMGKRN